MIYRASSVASVLVLWLLITSCARVQVITTGLMENAPNVVANNLILGEESREFTPNTNMFIFVKGETLKPRFIVTTQVLHNGQLLQHSVEDFVVSPDQPPTNDSELQKKFTNFDNKLGNSNEFNSTNPQQRPFLIVLSKFLNDSTYPKGEPLKLEIYVDKRLVAWHYFKVRVAVHIPQNMILDTVGSDTKSPNPADNASQPSTTEKN